MSDLDTILNTTLSDLPPSLPAPPGKYHAVIRRYETKTIGQNNTPVAVLTVKLLEPLEGQDMDGVNLRDNAGLVDHQLWLTEKSLPILVKTANKTFGISTEKRPVKDILDDMVGRDVVAVVTHREYTNKDGEVRQFAEAKYLNKYA